MVIKQAAFIFPREQESVQEFAIQWKMGDYGSGSLQLIFTALYISKGLLILQVLPAPSVAAEIHSSLQN